VQVTMALARSVNDLGGRIHLDEPALGVTNGKSGSLVITSKRKISTGHVINAAGLYADRVADWFGMADDYAMMPFKGLYWYGSWPKGRLQRHVYPVPNPANPFLGVHLTVTVDGGVKIGPTAIPALWREDYGGLEGFNRRESADILRRYPDFLRSPHHKAGRLIASEVPKYSRRYLVRQASKLVPSITQRDFTQRGRVGVRAQMFHKPTRRLEMDFVLRGDSRSTHMLNAVSPAWTSALAMAEYVVDDIELRTR
jgi:(S)-2-hydroxyglutarate dehydrogenase